MIAALLAFSAALSAPNRLPPVDRCKGDASFTAFRMQLARAADRRDARAVMALLSDDVMVDFGGGSGKAAFAKAWKLDRPRESGLWDEVKTILRLGCVHEKSGWLMPSFGSQLEVHLDPMTTLFAIRPGSALRSQPRADAPVVTRLDWDVLILKEVSGDDGWLRVSLHDGREGYVRPAQVRSPLDPRMTVDRINGRLRITAFVAGD